ncbi:leucyl aminopeptidase [Mastigocladopsis repens]|uniref:leucyl aminopeptidase n=1 Tax=Mastigocladopsis repens TaxID=221287 RepID=UPI0002D52DD3|nr:leucyl aminopeptidase [Mastigocladopsis repens]
MEIRGTDTPLLKWTGDGLAIGLFEDAVELTGELATLDENLAGSIKELITEEEFKGKQGSSIVTRVGAGSPVRKIILVGLGKPEALTIETLRRAAAVVGRLAKKQKCRTLGISLPIWNNDRAQTAQALAEGVQLALYQDNRFKSEPEDKGPQVEQVDLLGLGGQEAAITRANQISSGVFLARQLVAAPANSVTPITMAETAVAIASEHSLQVEILEQEDCERLGMGAFLGVAKASELPPKFIHLTYKPAGAPKRKIAIIGKGVTFDSGGLNIKGAGSGIETMKMDMGGAAATLGAAKAIGQLKPDVEVHFISAVTENMISGHAMHPGDILTASNGKTIEVNNTDAEGRLTLADALVFAEKLGVDAIVDLATLTGACIIALGDEIAGLFSPDDALAGQLQKAGETAGEKFWRLPMEEKYFEGLKSGIADMKNTGPRAGGSITAALFLKQFVKETPWAHLDVAGPVWTEKENGYNSPGATGFGVRTLVNWVLSEVESTTPAKA